MKNIVALLLLLCGLAACHKHEYYQTNPNLPTTATPALLLTGICTDVINLDPAGPAFAARYLTYYERPNENVNYGWLTSGFDTYSLLNRVQQMDKLARASGEQQYVALAHFFRAVLFMRLTETFGDIPYSEALRAEEGFDRPVYDSQASIYTGLLTELETANTLLSTNNKAFAGDVIFNGNAQKWQKAVNALSLRLLIHLSKKENDPSLNVKQRFAAIANDPTRYPLMGSNDDNIQLVFNISAPNNYYPTFNNLSYSSLVSLEKGLVKLLKDRSDPRLFRFGDPIVGQTANNFNSYEGIDAGLSVSDQQNGAPTSSKLHRRFVTEEVNEPLILLGYSEQEFNRAEAVARGWVTGDASGHYVNGIRASLQFYGLGGPSSEPYFSKPLVKYNDADALTLIATQKYLSMFMQSGWEPFLEQRRTGIPSFSTGPGTLNNGQVPKRWRYPQTEVEQNRTNLDQAVARQYNGSDDVNQVMWLLK